MTTKPAPNEDLAGVHHRPIFKTDFQNHALYLADHNPSAALKFVDAVDETLALIATQPYMGALRVFAAGAVHLRMVPVAGFKNYLIYYQPLERGLIAIRLLHASMDSLSVFE